MGLLLLSAAVARADSTAPDPGTGPDAADSSNLPDRVDLRPSFDQFGLSPGNQGGRGTCSAFTLLGGIEFATARLQGRTPRLSVEYLNWASNETCGDRLDGGFFSDLWRGFTNRGVCTSTAWAYQPRFDPEARPSDGAMAEAATLRRLPLRTRWIKEWDVHTGLTADQFRVIKQTLRSGWPVCAGFRWPKEEQWIEGVLQPRPPGEVFDGHSVLLVGYRDDASQPGGGVFLFFNSSNASRDARMAYAHATAYLNDAVVIVPLPAARIR